MKKINLLLIVICLIAFNVNAQKWVKTTAQNKNAVLEEFTGIHCGYCPDGHKRANDILAANPGRVVLVNIHAGSFATPSGTELDFRTTDGTAIDAAAGVTGYPAGSVNRTKTPWAENRGNWAASVTDILSQPSPVNIAVKAYVDFPTRTLTTEVEVFYTSNAAQSSNKLTVELIQDKILGTQSDYGNFNPDYWYNGQYMHMHAFRQMISSGGSFGENLDTTTAGHYTYRKYVTVLPATIKNIEVYLYNLKVVAFVSATNANIYTGAEADVEFDPNLKTDLGMTDLTSPPTGLVFTTVHPKVEVTNNLDQTVTSFDVTATINGTKNLKSFAGTLAKGQKTTIDWGELPITLSGSYTISIAGFENINGGTIYDMDFKNNTASYTGMGFKNNAFSTVKAGFNGTMPTNFAFDQSKNKAFTIVNGSGTTVCGANNTTGAVRFSLNSTWNVSGLPGDIVFGVADFTTLTKPFLTFFYAYSDDSYGGTPPTIKVSVSDDAGVTWKEVRSYTAAETGAPATHGYYYVPTSSEYIWVGVPLESYANKSVLIKISCTPGTDGNALFIDEISIAQSNDIADQSVGNFHFGIYPNPVSDVAQITFSIDRTSDVSFDIFNSLGQKVLSTEMSSYNAGTQSFNINTSTLERGAYVGVLKVDGKSFITKIVK